MEKIFYADKSAYSTSEAALRAILSQYFDIQNAEIARTEKGKPILVNKSALLFFSVAHTKEMLFIAFSDREIGIDAELKTREVQKSVLKKFHQNEQADIHSNEDFLRLWTMKESVVKWLGGTLACDLRKIQRQGDKVVYDNRPLPVTITYLETDSHILSVCSENRFQNADWIEIV